MKTPLIARRKAAQQPDRRRGVTMILVALAMVAIIAMAALSIDVVSLYLAKEEAQRSADSAAVAGAKILVLGGITGDPNNSKGNWAAICGGSGSPATLAAQAVAQQDSVSGTAVPTGSITVMYAAGASGSITQNADCSQLAATAFGVNPLVTVSLTRSSLPNFFSRIWGNPGTSVSAAATAEAFNPSNSGNVGNQGATGTITPVQPWCVKPWVVPNLDPLNPLGNPGTCTTNCKPFVDTGTGVVQNPGMSLGGVGTTGVIGETFWLVADCRHNAGNCTLRVTTPQANLLPSPPFRPATPNVTYLPGQVNGTNVLAVPACANGDQYEQAIGGCDQPTNYTCGVPPSSGGTNAVDLAENPESATSTGAACLIHQSDTTNLTSSSGQDYFNTFAAPAAYPFQIYAGSGNPLVSNGLASGTPITTSASVVSLPIYDQTTAPPIASGGTTNLTYLGFLQVFINAVDNYGNVRVTVLNVAGCSNGGAGQVGPNPIIGNSPIPVRLITPPTS